MTITAEPTKKQSLTEILDLDKGESIDIDQFIRREERLVMQDRSTMRSRYKEDNYKPWLVCSLCGAAVQLVCHKDRTFFFRHQPEEENRGCPVNTKGQFSAKEINAMKYNGAKESLAHIQLKEILKNSILADPSFKNPPEIERVWKGMERKIWRKPDVQATWQERRIAFEIQLSTTFLSIIIDRKEFYQNENGSLLWIFQSFNPNRTRRAEEDIFFNNNSNVFIVNQQTLQKSIETTQLIFECWYPLPRLRNGDIYDDWQHDFVSIDNLKFEQSKQRIYFFDYETEKAKLELSLIDTGLRNTFESFWKEHGNKPSKIGLQQWQPLREKFKTYGIELPEFYNTSPFSGVVSIMLSAKYSKPIGYDLEKMIQVTNVVFNSYKPYLYLFGKALQQYGDIKLTGQDIKGTWAKQRKLIREGMETKNPSYDRNKEYDDLIKFLLPELKNL
jgi:hypothetical protein